MTGLEAVFSSCAHATPLHPCGCVHAKPVLLPWWLRDHFTLRYPHLAARMTAVMQNVEATICAEYSYYHPEAHDRAAVLGPGPSVAVLRLIRALRELFVLIFEGNQLRIAASRSPPPSFFASAIYSPDTKFRGPKSTAHLQGQSTSIKLPGGAHLSSGSSDYRKRPESHPTNLLLSLTVAEMILRVPVGRVQRVRTSG